MRERGIALLLSLASLLAFYTLWLRPSSSLDPDADAPRPTSVERRGDGYAGLVSWLDGSGVTARSWRERYTALADADLPPRGNLLMLTLPGVEMFRHEEFAALDRWVKAGNTLVINAALLDQPRWAAGSESGALVEIESLTSLEFETRKAREARLDDTPLAQRVREADARDAAGDERAEEPQPEPDYRPLDQRFEDPEKLILQATGPHALLRDVRTLGLESDFEAGEWSLRMPYDSFLLTLARTPDGEGALFEQRLGKGRILVSAGATLFSNRALGEEDNARFAANLIGVTLADDGVVLFDDLRQGLSASYDPALFYDDPRLWITVAILTGLWFLWVLGGTRLRARVALEPDPSEADLVRRTGGLVSRTVAPWNAALALFDHFFAGVARAARGATGLRIAERGELWSWLERHAAIRPQDLDQIKAWYADAHSMRKVPLVELQNLLDQLERRLKT
jgi:hypothetical protein